MNKQLVITKLMCNLGNVFYKNICNGKNSKRSDRHLRIDKYLQDIGT